MLANLPPQYFEAEKRYREARMLQDGAQISINCQDSRGDAKSCFWPYPVIQAFG